MNIATVVEWSDLMLAIAAPSVTKVLFTSEISPSPELHAEYSIVQSTIPEGYRYSWSDLEDLKDTSNYEEWEVPVSAKALRMGAFLIAQLQDVARAPEVSALDNGVLALTWVFASGYVVVEVGSTSYGLLVMRDGEPIVMRNGQAWELYRLVKSEIVPLFSPGSTQAAPVAQSDLGMTQSRKNPAPAVLSWLPSFGGASAAPA